MASGENRIQDRTPHLWVRPKPAASCQRSLWSSALALLLASAGSAAVSKSSEPELKSQPPWDYTYRTNVAEQIDFLAATPAIENRDVWLLLACKSGRIFYASLVDAGTFGFPLGERTELTLRLDELPPMSLPSAVVEKKVITARPNSPGQFFYALRSSNLLFVTVPEQGGSLIHMYSFSLQPNDLALRDIDVHCFHSGT